MGRMTAAQRRKQQEEARKRRGSFTPTRGHGGGQGNRNRVVEKPTKSRGANAAYTSDKIEKNRNSSEAKAKATTSNLASRAKPVTKPTKPTATKPTKPTATKPIKPTVTKPTKPTQPKNAGAGNGAPRPTPAEKVPAKKPHIKSSRLRDALKSVKKYRPKK